MLPNPTSRDEDINNPKLSLFVVGIVAGAAGVTALALSDKDIRKKVSKRAHDMRLSLQKWSSSQLHEYRTKSKTMDENDVDKTIETLSTEEEKIKN